jgi:pimeloyl-ACP methyl ester carboxylesterase
LRSAVLAAATAVALVAAACSDEAPDATVEVDGRTLHLECTGNGSPTVVLQAGFGNAGDIWSLSETDAAAVQPALAATNRVCSYDRPGSMIITATQDGKVVRADALQSGRSDAAPMPRDPKVVVTELHDLLAAADVPGPYVMVGHSLGGTFSVLYARTYPDDVRALVVVDSPLPPVRGLVGAATWEPLSLLSIDPAAVPGYELESYDQSAAFDEIEAAGPLPDIPVVVVRRGKVNMSDDPLPDGAPLTQAELDAINGAQREAQVLWAEGVPGAEVITVPDTTHDVHTQRPDAVVAAIRDAIARS